MAAQPRRMCNRCDTALNESGSCSNSDCKSNHPTWRPFQSGQRSKNGGAFREVDMDQELCPTCLSGLNPDLPTCMQCGSTTDNYRAVMSHSLNSPRVPAEMRHLAEPKVDPDPPTNPGTPRAIKRSKRLT